MLITSVQNPKIKYLLKLFEKSRERKKEKCFVVEGVQENNFALLNEYKPLEFFICQELFNESILLDSSIKTFFIDKNVYEKIAFRGSTEGIIGVYEEKKHSLENVKLSENATILIVESIEKPGNLGAILRTCDAFNVDLLIICDPLVDIFNPNVIRSSVGSIFNIPSIILDKEKCLDFCNNNSINIYSTFMNENSLKIWDLDFNQKTALIFGTEHSGVSSFWKGKVTNNFIIPMFGKVDSLNVSNALAISLYEVIRNKNKKNLKN